MVQFIALLIAVALAVNLFWWIVGIVGVIGAVHWGRRVADRHAERVEAERRRLAGWWPALISNTGGFWLAMSAVCGASSRLLQCDSRLITSLILLLNRCFRNWCLTAF
jgi:hypothetical protein